MDRLHKKITRSSTTTLSSSSSSKKKPTRKSYDVPDYDALYKKFIVELETKKAENRKITKAEPFALSTDNHQRSRNDDSKGLRKSNSMSRLSKLIVIFIKN